MSPAPPFPLRPLPTSVFRTSRELGGALLAPPGPLPETDVPALTPALREPDPVNALRKIVTADDRSPRRWAATRPTIAAPPYPLTTGSAFHFSHLLRKRPPDLSYILCCVPPTRANELGTGRRENFARDRLSRRLMSRRMERRKEAGKISLWGRAWRDEGRDRKSVLETGQLCRGAGSCLTST